MADSYAVPFHFYHDSKRCFIGIRKNITTLDLIELLFVAASLDFPDLKKSEVSFVSAKDNDPFVVGICFEATQIPEKYQELKFPIKIL